MLDVECYCTLARRAARALTAYYDERLAASGLRVAQYSLLRTIERLPGASLTALAQGSGLDRSTLGRNLRVLEKAGFVDFAPVRDERARVAALTPRARRALALAAPLWADAQAGVAAAAPPQTKERLRALATLATSEDEP